MFLILSSIFFLPLVYSASCPDGSKWSADYNVCYLVTTKGAHWTAAEGICRYLGGHLPAVRSKQHNDYLWSISRTHLVTHMWIGANTVDGVWTNSDGTPANYTNIMPNNPLKYVHNVAALTSSGWTVENDTTSIVYGFICELPSCPDDGSQPASLLYISDNTTGLYYGDMSNSWFYGTYYTQSNPYQSEEHCKSVKGNLPAIHNAFQNSQFKDVILGMDNEDYEDVSLGLESDNFGNWAWMDGSSFNYNNWNKGEPGVRYTRFSTYNPQTTTWFSSTENFDLDTLTYICQFPLDNRKIC